MTEDCISRQAVLDGLASIAKVKARSDAQKSLMGRIMFFVEQLPPVTPKEKTKWIPVSERLPEEDGCYLVTTTGTNNDIIDIAYYTDGIWHKASRIKAWMLLPTPFEPQESEDKE